MTIQEFTVAVKDGLHDGVIHSGPREFSRSEAVIFEKTSSQNIYLEAVGCSDKLKKSSGFLSFLCRVLCWPPPLLTLSLFTIIVVIRYADSEANNKGYGPHIEPQTDKNEWYSPWSSCFTHSGAAHLWTNAVVLLFGGWILEATESTVAYITIVWVSGLCGVGMAALLDRDKWVRGTSGICYGILFSQAALLALNWREMLLKWIRLAFLLLLLGFDIAVITTTDTGNTSNAGHMGGAVGGILAALVVGGNVVYEKWEVVLNCLGLLGYLALIAVYLADEQYWLTMWAIFAIPVLSAKSVYNLHRFYGQGTKMKATQEEVTMNLAESSVFVQNMCARDVNRLSSDIMRLSSVTSAEPTPFPDSRQTSPIPFEADAPKPAV